MNPVCKPILLIFLLSSLAGCARRPAATYQPLAAATTAAPETARLLFLSCRLTAAPAGTQLEVLQAKAVPGDLKIPEADADTPDFLRVLQLDGQGQVLNQVRVPHPLRRSVEHVADDHRTFQRSEVVLLTAEFFVRLALRPTTAAIRVEEVVAGTTAKLSEFPIPSKS
ncbi:hypothetical protein [Hymenobacter negativus]|uniref:DUF4249 family protein n=1 Tax=Hymenobacter negativus TaxID=2795026 RepID=A0ABS0Q4B6_9BACT|nr:hypothetical protein [Hymenobacter negativus]MBH8557511.1 hypothetical protein [Hymenobacter negativus]